MFYSFLSTLFTDTVFLKSEIRLTSTCIGVYMYGNKEQVHTS